MAFKMQVDILKLFSQWAISTGEKGHKNFWGFFLLPLKALESPYPSTTSSKEFLQNKSVQKKKISPSLKVTLDYLGPPGYPGPLLDVVLVAIHTCIIYIVYEQFI